MTRAGITNEQRAICAAVGVSEAAFLSAAAAMVSAQSKLTDEERKVCQAIGITEDSFLRTKEAQAARGADSR
jgi:hypothetical protein